MRIVGAVALLALWACDGEVREGGISRPRDAGPNDSGGNGDGAATDLGLGDGGQAPDAAPEDQGVNDSGVTDSGVTDDWPANLARTEEQLLVLLNEQRAIGANCGGQTFGPTGPVVMHPALRRSARLHSQDMADQNYFEHNSLDGRTPFQRMADAGYDAFGFAENIAAGNADAASTFEQWLNSPGHCRNMMAPEANEIGIGHGYNREATYRDYWTQNFGQR